MRKGCRLLSIEGGILFLRVPFPPLGSPRDHRKQAQLLLPFFSSLVVLPISLRVCTRKQLPPPLVRCGTRRTSSACRRYTPPTVSRWIEELSKRSRPPNMDNVANFFFVLPQSDVAFIAGYYFENTFFEMLSPFLSENFLQKRVQTSLAALLLVNWGSLKMIRHHLFRKYAPLCDFQRVDTDLPAVRRRGWASTFHPIAISNHGRPISLHPAAVSAWGGAQGGVKVQGEE